MYIIKHDHQMSSGFYGQYVGPFKTYRDALDSGIAGDIEYLSAPEDL